MFVNRMHFTATTFHRPLSRSPTVSSRCTPHRVANQLSSALAVDNDYPNEVNERFNAKPMLRLNALRERLRQEDMTRATSRTSYYNTSLITSTINSTNSMDNILTDTHGRHHNYLRISLSERCNLRCQYCMPPEGVPLSPSSHLLTNNEIIQLTNLFVKNGVNKIRLTGGEPLLRKDIVPLVQSISDSLQMSKYDSPDNGSNGLVGITTNGISLSRHVKDLVDAGLTGINISLDTLREDRFVEITRRKGLHKVMRSIQDSVDVFKDKYGDVRVEGGGSRVKINCVVMKNFNDDEIIDFVHMANQTFKGDVDMRFIEWMPFNDNGWNRSRFVSYNDMIAKISHGERNFQLVRIGDGPNDTTKWWRVQQEGSVAETKSRIGFITSMSEHFCASCNRLRITADGKIKVCLFGSNEKEISLRDIMRQSNAERLDGNEDDLSRVIRAAVRKKAFSLGGHDNPDSIALAANNRPMTLIGG
eukprot:scaffold14615_cov65-Cyclotella_meneghiniana.AAC.19